MYVCVPWLNVPTTDGKPAPAAGGTKNLKLLPVILTCIPYTVAAVTSWLVAHSSQKRKELYMHTAIPAMIGGELLVVGRVCLLCSSRQSWCWSMLVCYTLETRLSKFACVCFCRYAVPLQVSSLFCSHSFPAHLAQRALPAWQWLLCRELAPSAPRQL